MPLLGTLKGRQDRREGGRTEERQAGRKRGRQDGREGGRTEEREAGQKRGRQTDGLGTGLCPAQLAAKTEEEPMSQEMWAPQG